MASELRNMGHREQFLPAYQSELVTVVPTVTSGISLTFRMRSLPLCTGSA